MFFFHVPAMISAELSKTAGGRRGRVGGIVVFLTHACGRVSTLKEAGVVTPPAPPARLFVFLKSEGKKMCRNASNVFWVFADAMYCLRGLCSALVHVKGMKPNLSLPVPPPNLAVTRENQTFLGACFSEEEEEGGGAQWEEHFQRFFHDLAAIQYL